MGLLAEQVLIDCRPARLEELFSHRPATWIAPLLRLAGDEGEAAGLALLGESGAADRRQAPRRRSHRAEVGDPWRADCSFHVSLVWRTTDYRVLFSELEGTIEIRPFGDHTVLGVEGRFTEPSCPLRTGPVTVAMRRAAESATRSLLGHLRSAVEQSAYSAR